MEHCLPSMAGRNHPRIWDAGVAMGQEPYTLSILFAERMGHFAFNNLRIDATDVESTGQFAQDRSRRACTRRRSCRGCPKGILEKYFEANGKPGHFRVIDKVRQRVAFQWHDLLSLKEIGHDYSLVVVQERAAPLPSAGKDRSAEDVSSGAGVRAASSPPSRRRRCRRNWRSLFERVIPDGQLFRKVEAAACGS